MIHTTRKETTSAVSKDGEEEYKPSGSTAGREVKRSEERKILRELKETIYDNLKIETHWNIQFSNEHIFDILMRAGLRHSFVEDTCNSLLRKGIETANADTVYYRLKKVDTENGIRMFDKANYRLMKTVQKRRAISPYPCLSCDIHPIMFYGDKETDGVMGCRPKKGSHRAFEYLTIVLSQQEIHPTVSARPLRKDMKIWDVLEGELLYAFRFTKRPFLLFMDREFYSAPVVNMVEKHKQKYLMPAKKTAPVKKLMKENKAPCVLPYTMEGKYGTADTTLVFVDDDNGETRAFATNLKIEASQAKTLFDQYENRWTVDTSYRMVGQVRMNSKTVEYAVRWFLFLFSVLILNGYWLFNDDIKEYDHVTLITYAELFVEIEMREELEITNKGDG